ncbi:MAG: tRNA 2-thiouridine(34) synthase MnmA [Actinomycetales bacterium]
MKVLAAMSGGVDSAVAAARAVDAGHEVVGVHLALSRNPQALRTGARGCCTAEDAGDARRAADVIGIPFYVWDLSERFEADVVDDFVAEYAAGRTPNPCLRCNEKIKFSALLDKARALGFDAVCTGHYARVETVVAAGQASAVRRELHRAADPAKDQSYVLAVLTEQQLAGAMFPLGGSCKADVRTEAEDRGLTVAHKPDSHDICFVSDGDTAGYLARRLGPQPGQIVDESGDVVGRHEGAYAFTVGQRHGLRLGRPAPDGRPRYVLAIEPVSGRVTVGPAASLEVTALQASSAAFPSGATTTGLAGGRTCLAQVRAHAEPVPCHASYDGHTLRARLDQPVRGVATGQGLVLYDGSRVLAAGRIVATSGASAA